MIRAFPFFRKNNHRLIDRAVALPA
jgi:hypothetical protein